MSTASKRVKKVLTAVPALKYFENLILEKIYRDIELYIILICDTLAGSGNGYLKSSYEGEKCIEVAYIELSAGWVSTGTAGYLIWTEAPQLLDCSTRSSQKRIHCALKSVSNFCIHVYISSSVQ